MGLLNTDKMPKGISLKAAYGKVYSWYTKNIDLIKSKPNEYTNKSVKFIETLPAPSKATDLQMRYVMREIILGALEWAYHQSDGEYKMAAYAHAAVEPYGGYKLTEEELKLVRSLVN